MTLLLMSATPDGSVAQSIARLDGEIPVQVVFEVGAVLNYFHIHRDEVRAVLLDVELGSRIATLAHVLRVFCDGTPVCVVGQEVCPDRFPEHYLSLATTPDLGALTARLQEFAIARIVADGVSRFIHLNGYCFHYVDSRPSGGPVVLILTGKSGGAHDAIQTKRVLHPYYRTLGFDYRGHGLSEWNRTYYSVKQYASDVEAFIRALDLRDIVFITECFGGQIIAQLALDIPDRIDRVLLAQTRAVFFGPTFEGPRPPQLTATYPDQIPAHLPDEATVRAFLRKKLPEIVNPAWHDLRVDHMFRKTHDGYALRQDRRVYAETYHRFNEFYDGPNFRTVFEALTCPIMLLTHPGLFDDEWAAYLAARPNVTTAESEAWGFENFSPTFVAALVDFLELY